MYSADDFKYNFGDIVTVKGIQGLQYVVESFRYEIAYWEGEKDAQFFRIYELTEIHSGTYAEVDEEDIEQKVGEMEIDEWDDEDDDDEDDAYYIYLSFDQNNEGDDKMKKGNERNLTAREESAREADRRKQARKERSATIDRLLDDMNDAKALYALFKDRKYRDRVTRIKKKLSELN